MVGKRVGVLGTASVVVFFVLLGFIVFNVVQGQEEPEEEPRVPGPHPLDGFGPEDIPLTPYTQLEIEGRNLLEEVTVDCSGGTPRLLIQAREPLPAGAMIRLRRLAVPIPDPGGFVARYPPVGEPELVSLAQAAASVGIELSPSIVTGDFDSFSVSVRFTEPGGGVVASNILRLPAADVRCSATR